MTAWGAIGHALASPGCASLTRATVLTRPFRPEGTGSRPAPERRDLEMRSPAKVEGRIRGRARTCVGQTTLANRPTPLPLSDGERGRSISRARRDGTRPRRSELPRVLQGGLAGVAAGAEALVEAEAELGAGAEPGAGGEAEQSAGAGRVDRGQR